MPITLMPTQYNPGWWRWGVQTAAQRDLLLGLQCDEMQGEWFARPMPAEALAVSLTSWPAKQSVGVVEMQ